MLLWRDYECHHRNHEQTVSDICTAANQTVHVTTGHYYTEELSCPTWHIICRWF